LTGVLKKVSDPVVRKAWKQVKSNKGKPGIDGTTVEAFPMQMRPLWPETLQTVFDGTYDPMPVRRVEIPKLTGGSRPLGIPTVLDRVIQQAIAQILGARVDPTFSEYSYGFRPRRSAHQAVRQVRSYIVEGYRVAVDVDLRQFFDRVDHDVLMHYVGKHVRDKRVMALIGKYLRAGFSKDGRLHQTRMGVPQGGPLSPLLANILLHELDRELEKRGHRFARYADDFIIMVKSQRAGERVLASIQRFLERKLKLQVNEDKSRVVPASGCEFLGFVFRGKKIRWSEKAFLAFKRRIRELTGRSWFVPMRVRLHKLAQYLRGWMTIRQDRRIGRPFGRPEGAAQGWAESTTSASRNTTDRCRNWITGCVAGCGCATGNSGATAAPRRETCASSACRCVPRLLWV